MAELRREEIAANLHDLQTRIATACDAAGRPADDVRLIAVTKTWPVADVQILADLGVTLKP